MERITDPNKVPVQLNITVPFEFREHLHKLAEERHTSLTQMCREALMTMYPIHRGMEDLPTHAS